MSPTAGNFGEDMASVDDALAKLDTELSAPLLEELLSASEGVRTSESQSTPTKATPKSKRRRVEPRNEKTKITVRLAALLIALSIAGTTVALTQTTLPAELFELWKTQYQDTDFTISFFRTRIPNPDRVRIRLTLTNIDTSVHYANVTVTLLNTTGSEIMNQTQATGAVAGGGWWDYTFVFNQANVGNEYQDSWIEIEQSS